VKFEAGELEAVSYNKNKIVSRDKRTTAGKPVALSLRMIDRPELIKADGADMVLVEVEVIDENGQRCPDVHPLVNFTLDGPAEWRGGIGQGPDNYILNKTLPAECGVNRAIIRTLTNSGEVKILATSEGLKSATLNFTIVPFVTSGGLTEVLPSSGLKGNLQKGETPESPSFKVSRKSLEIVSTKAGINQEKSIQSYDDNELSEWTNDGKLSTGWISYQLKKKSLVTDISLKLSGWRSVSYPLEILVDDKIVWTGNTPQSLGYVNLQLKPTKGKVVTIRLMGATSEKDAFQNMIELNGNKELDGFKNTKNLNTKGQLRIVEIDVLSKIK
jgi:hypothetical protein